MKFKPLHDYVLIDPTPVETETEAGIILQLTDTNKAPTIGTVVDVGPGRVTDFPNPNNIGAGHRIRINLKPGDVVQWHKFAGTIIKQDDKDLLLMHYTEIIGVYENV